ncbi:MAG: OadG family protein [Treponema sp.]|jgi:oxaloacetate decarboxylase gamma subunit|nr:OadG family protein [Treponema sp.]
MTILQMLEQSGALTLLGIGVVFSFLIIMVICVSVMGKIMHALGADKDISGTGSSGFPASPVKTTTVAAAITAAVSEYQKNNS